MIASENLPDFLALQGFAKTRSGWRKAIGTTSLEVDVAKQQLSGKVLPLFLTRMMNSEAFQKEAKGKAAKAVNQANINATVMKNLKVPLPILAEQEAFVAFVLERERAIAAAREVIVAAPAKKQAIMQRYL